MVSITDTICIIPPSGVKSAISVPKMNSRGTGSGSGTEIDRLGGIGGDSVHMPIIEMNAIAMPTRHTTFALILAI